MAYNPTEWEKGDEVTAALLNQIEQGIKSLDHNKANATGLHKKADKLYVNSKLSTKADKSYVDGIVGVGGLDITKLSPQFVTQLQIPGSRVGQSFEKDPKTGDYFVAQTENPLNQQATYMDVLIHHMSRTGVLLDTLRLEGAGHGSEITINYESDVLYIWLWWSKDTVGNNNGTIVRFQHSDGLGTLKRDSSKIEEQKNFEGVYNTVSIDEDSNRIAFRVRDKPNNQESLVLRSLSDYKRRVDNTYHTIGPYTIPDLAYQGFATVDDKVFVARGGNKHTDNVITQYDWATGSSKDLNVNYVGLNPDGSDPGNHNENEGMSIWRPVSGNASLLFQKIVGPQSARRSLIYSFVPIGSNDDGREQVRSLSRGQYSLTYTSIYNSGWDQYRPIHSTENSVLCIGGSSKPSWFIDGTDIWIKSVDG